MMTCAFFHSRLILSGDPLPLFPRAWSDNFLFKRSKSRLGLLLHTYTAVGGWPHSVSTVLTLVEEELFLCAGSMWCLRRWRAGPCWTRSASVDIWPRKRRRTWCATSPVLWASCTTRASLTATWSRRTYSVSTRVSWRRSRSATLTSAVAFHSTPSTATDSPRLSYCLPWVDLTWPKINQLAFALFGNCMYCKLIKLAIIATCAECTAIADFSSAKFLELIPVRPGFGSSGNCWSRTFVTALWLYSLALSHCRYFQNAGCVGSKYCLFEVNYRLINI